MNRPIFITGIGTGVGKTIVASIVAEALNADYWKPVQTGHGDGSDSELVGQLVSNGTTRVHHEGYKLTIPGSPHIAAEKNNLHIDLEVLERSFRHLSTTNPYLVIEGAGGLLVPLNEEEFIIDLIKKLDARVIIVSRNYLGSINHSLMTAQLCKQHNLDVIGWVFNDKKVDYEEDIIRWSGYPALGKIPFGELVNKDFVLTQAAYFRGQLANLLEPQQERKNTRKNKPTHG